MAIESGFELSNKLILITGGNQGIGFHTALTLAQLNAHVIIASRNEQLSIEAVNRIKNISGNDHEFCEDFKKNYDHLDILINNPGIHTGDHRIKDGIEYNVYVNCLGTFTLTNLLVPLLEKSESTARIVNLSSMVHHWANKDILDSFHPTSQKFGQQCFNCKLITILYTKELSKRLLHKNIISVAVHPGIINTNCKPTPSTWHPVFKFLLNLFYLVYFAIFGISAEEGAKTTIFAASDSSVKSGEYYDNFKAAKISKLAKDEELARKVWVKSAELTRIDPNLI